MLLFDIKQTWRLIFDGAGMIIFKQEWEDNCAKQLALVTGENHPLHGSSIQRLMGTNPAMITPQAQAEGLWAHEVIITTRAAQKAIRASSKLIVRPSPLSTVKESKNESFTQFMNRLQAALDSSALPSEVKGPVLVDCLRQQCNSSTKDILRSLPPGKEIAANHSSSHKKQMLKSTSSPSNILAKPTLSNPFLRLLNATFLSLNQSNPNLTESCWLCYDAQPRFYEGVALDLPFLFSKSHSPRQCRWDTPRRGITLSQVTGQGKCFGNATLAMQMGNVCLKFVKLKGGKFQWVIPAALRMWVCQRSKVSPCVLLN
ncbi:uncharacterized protein LOC130266146 [Oenanthe melanoleuca]|uniref:uncharacterized protein LOC130266146 n=1 Tax=Oenanthe melanoleuca TaxID=2939378 RepID=UPI0024C11CD9|nr:uncharacterized protein LOC130266146 [Oenanthe melanoleuca]